MEPVVRINKIAPLEIINKWSKSNASYLIEDIYMAEGLCYTG